ncbi:superinfection immunity protein [Paraburkholderia unamae]|uniref:T4 superinfection immunity protein n=1 Tax=Paraburkholderia unamae TaxID=219649 RepID=A0ABX5KLB9_9BURK|nr:superinfection immunity protein [Paraburkholderia unamae]PVX82811.1 T4 superinfection immunity protein [Paraburkholderia unamae]CAG9269238.1 T4 superinfection immunity protein [Paraburkholderia unamae]
MLQILEGAAVIAALTLYLIPSIEADARNHRDAFAITLVNVLLGWTIVGWFAARAWAHSRHNGLLPRTAMRIRGAAGHATSEKLVQHATLRTALTRREKAARGGAAEQCS